MYLKNHIYIIGLVILCFVASCDDAKEHTAPAVRDQDSVSMMTSYGVNTLISDSGIMRYRIIAERWEVNEVVSQPRWMFKRGIFMEQFDEKFHVESYVQSDTAYYFTNKNLWHLWGNVRVKTTDGLRFSSQELWWDQNRHELYSNMFSHLITPERELQGAYFTSDEHMQHYTVTNTKGAFTREDMTGENNNGTAPTDSTPKRQAIAVRKK